MLKKFEIFAAIIFALTVMSGCERDEVRYYSQVTEDNIETSTDTDVSQEENSTEDTELEDLGFEKIPVFVCGAVVSPGVYYVDITALKSDALDMAGGLLEEAADDYVNLAETVTSGEKIYFPYAYEVPEGQNMAEAQSEEVVESGKININHATKEELMTLPGIGESKAEAIIKYREQYGPFQTIEDITNISGIKDGVYNNIKDYIVAN